MSFALTHLKTLGSGGHHPSGIATAKVYPIHHGSHNHPHQAKLQALANYATTLPQNANKEAAQLIKEQHGQINPIIGMGLGSEAFPGGHVRPSEVDIMSGLNKGHGEGKSRLQGHLGLGGLADEWKEKLEYLKHLEDEEDLKEDLHMAKGGKHHEKEVAKEENEVVKGQPESQKGKEHEHHNKEEAKHHKSEKNKHESDRNKEKVQEDLELVKPEGQEPTVEKLEKAEVKHLTKEAEEVPEHPKAQALANNAENMGKQSERLAKVTSMADVYFLGKNVLMIHVRCFVCMVQF
jgi:hypothetical protein